MPKMISIRWKVVVGFLLFLLPLVIVGGVFISGFTKIILPLNLDIPNSLKDLNLKSELDSTAQFVRYYDEVLTQSARNYAFTGNPVWKDRYLQTVPELDTKIKIVLEKGDEADKKIFADIDTANLALVAMEEQALKLVDQEKSAEAVAILESADYQRQKTIYQNGLVKYSEKRGVDYNQAITASTNQIEQVRKKVDGLMQSYKQIFVYTLIGSGLLVIILGWFFSNIIASPIKKISQQAQKIAAGELTQKIEVNSKDEIGMLAGSLNKMVEELVEAKSNIEKKVEERTLELARLNKFMIGRELRMNELKKEIEQLKKV